MAKKQKNLENIKIQWDGDLSKPTDGSAQSSPDNVDLGPWGGYVPCWYPDQYKACPSPSAMYFEDFDISRDDGLGGSENIPDGLLNIKDVIEWLNQGRADIRDMAVQHITEGCNHAGVELDHYRCPPPAPKTKWVWGDVSFVIEIADGIGTGSRRAREARLNQFEQEKKKRLIRLICRVKGEKVYDEEKEIGDTYIKLEDAELVIEKVLGKIRVENINVL